MTGSPSTETAAFSPNATIRFAPFEVRPHERILSKDGAPQRLGSRAFDLLLVLLHRRDRFVTADELRRIVWPDRVVEDNNLRVHLSALRKVLGPQAIVYHATQGYRLVPQVSADETDDAQRYPGNLPPRAELFGRTAVIAALGDALWSGQRVTVVGTAGVGKTTVALAAADEHADRYPDGVWLVELAALRSGTLVVSAVAQVLEVKLVNDTSIEALAKAIATRRALLVLDNCEHLVDAVTALCDALLRGAPGIVVLATSRKALRSGGEQVVPLGPLALPSAADISLRAARACGALALFESRVRVADPRFALTHANVAAAIEICQRLDGIALAIVLAASRVPLLGISGVRDRLRTGLLPLASRSVGVEDRHRTLVAALEWSHALLGVEEQAVFRRLGVFAGGFALSDAEQVCADDVLHPALDPPLDAERVVACIDGLIEHSLLVTDAAALHGLAAPRFTMHEMIRAHARARLDGHAEATALRRRHAEHFARIAEGGAGPGTMKRPDREQALPVADHDNLRAALDWSTEHEPALALRLATAATGFWRLRAHHAEALRRCEAVLARAEGEALAGARARLMIAMCGVAFEVHRLDLVELHAALCMDIHRASGDEHGMGQCVLWSAIVHYVRRDLETATTLYLDARRRTHDCGDRDGEANALANLASVATELGRYDEAVVWLHEALVLHRALGSHWGIALDMENLGEVAFARGDLVAAHADWVAALAEYRAVGHEFRIASMLQHLAAVLVRLDRLPDARESLVESLALCRRGGFDALHADGLGGLAAIAAAAGDGRTAAILLRSAARDRDRVGGLLGGIALKTDEHATRRARALLDDRQWRDACIDADRLSTEQAVALFEAAKAVRAISKL
jgi:predicted ATPase/DNA-binding winged helix-turn-helix (wHTH) protein